MARYPNISDHGLIGDLQTAALVTTDGTVDWFCCPRFDSPSVCASLLDADRGGYFRVGPDRDDYVSKQLYFPDTALLITRFMTPDGVGEVCDFMPVETGAATDRHRLVRQLRVVRGTMRFVMDFQPRFDYARQPHKLELCEDGAVFQADGLELTPRDPMWISTLDAMDRELVSDSLVYRYNPAASPDGLAGDEGTFSLCTFWYVEALARAGRLDEARLTFEKMHTYANHLGLYSEEIGSTGEQLGNSPQAFSHLALISAAINLDYQLDHGAETAGTVL